MTETQLSARFPLGSFVTEIGADVYKITGYWRGYVTLQHLATNTTHQAHPNSLRASK